MVFKKMHSSALDESRLSIVRVKKETSASSLLKIFTGHKIEAISQISWMWRLGNPVDSC